MPLLPPERQRGSTRLVSAVPTGLRIDFGFANPTLKRGANNLCACGAGYRLLPAWSGKTQVL